jgi:superfamily II DNA or RNA helicase
MQGRAPGARLPVLPSFPGEQHVGVCEHFRNRNCPALERARVRAELEDGTVQALVGVAVFLEGWDVPAVEVVILARAFTVHGGYLQAIGRGLRPSPPTGKTRCTVLDLRGAFNLHGLPDEDLVWSLEGKAVRRAEKMTALARCKECLAVFRPAACCPRCGVTTVGAPRIPRVLTRAEKAANVSGLPQSERDRRYFGALVSRAYRIGLPTGRAQAWALAKFRAKWKREPECAR